MRVENQGQKNFFLKGLDTTEEIGLHYLRLRKKLHNPR